MRQAQDPRKSAQSDSLGIRSTIRRWVRGTFRLLGRKRAMAEDAKQLFSTEEWLSFPEIEKNRFENILRNYKAMKDFGLDPKLPEFVVRQQRRRRNGLVAPTVRPPRVPDDEGDDEWTPEKERSSRYASKSGSVGGGRRGGLKRKAEWSAPAWTGRSENYDDAPLSVDQVDVIPLWTPAKLVAGAKGTVKIMPTTSDRSSGDSALENVKPEDKEVFSVPMSQLTTDTEMVTVKELPAKSETLGVGSDEEDCADCEEEKEGECSYHPLFLILEPRCSRRQRERSCSPHNPLAPHCLRLEVKGAGKGVWTNAHLPAHLVFGPYEGRVLSGHPEAGKESGYGWKIRGTGTRNTCIDAVDSAVSNWMRYVNCSRTEAETNLSTFQYKGQIYYKTDSAISRQAQDPRKSAQSDSLGIRSTIRRWVRGTFRLLGRKRAMAEDAKQLFSTEEWLSFPEIEKNRFENILRNYKAMKDFGELCRCECPFHSRRILSGIGLFSGVRP
ncbi:histone-lysine N-methyltransferase PRDM9-like [Penaeus vannamei]|uniref:Histone-lysine N-methyltransferase PRDM9-like n=1 Tax=Penaeus vannamei TaxID=6689 RepID=A0A3R7MH18_PENVA|nr:histone-lysine N-methyltransferase PRDM9-like [Penaeus vannamei]